MANGIGRFVVIGLLLLGSVAALTAASADQCSTAPITFEILNSAINQQPVEFDEAVPASDRQAVSEEERDAVDDLLHELVACSNAGEPLRVWSLYSADYLSRLFRIQGSFDEATYAAYAKPLPAERGKGMRLVSIEEVWSRGDGVLGAEVVMTYPSVPMPKRLIVWFSDTDGKLQIEEITGEISFSLP